MDTTQDFEREVCCEYKGREYLVRDNGSILRLPKEGSRTSKLDNVWTFGTKNPVNGYMIFSGDVRVHQVVCTAFHGPEPQPHMVVDHIDTNRCNNRPENLRWLTRIENALNNDVTRKKIIYLCGSIEAFIENPAILRTKALSPDVSWMKTVTKEEAAVCKKHMEEWAARDSQKQGTGKGIGDWIFSDMSEEEKQEAREWNGGHLIPDQPTYKTWAERSAEIEAETRRHYEEKLALKDSLTPGAKQLNWMTPTAFPLCPQPGEERTLEAYLKRLKPGATFTTNQYNTGSVVEEVGFNQEENKIYVLARLIENANPVALCSISLIDDTFIHKSIRSFLSEEGGHKYFTLAMGREWTGGDCIDDYV